MPLCYSVKAALSYIAAGSCGSVVYKAYTLRGCTITPHKAITPQSVMQHPLSKQLIRGVLSNTLFLTVNFVKVNITEYSGYLNSQ